MSNPSPFQASGPVYSSPAALSPFPFLWVHSWASPIWSNLPLVSRLFKQLQVQPNDNLPSRNLMKQQPLRDWSFGALVLLYLGQSDLSPAEEVCGDKTWSVKGRFVPLCGTKSNAACFRIVDWMRHTPSGENWSRSNTVMQRTSCSRSLIKNWQLEFHLGFKVSCKQRKQLRWTLNSHSLKPTLVG